jgi:hypothetical protein
MKIIILAAAALIATTLSAAADHEGSAPEKASNDQNGGGEALVNRGTGAIAASGGTDRTVKNVVATEALARHLPTAYVDDDPDGGY